MGKSIKPNGLGVAISRELTLYCERVTNNVNACGYNAIKKLVKRTKATAPVRSGAYKRAISSKEVDVGHGMRRYIWYVKDPHYRLTHLLAHGHVTKTGGRTKADPFLYNARDQVIVEYEEAVEEAIEDA